MYSCGIVDAYDISGRKRKRGKSCGKGVHDIIEANGGRKIPVFFDMGLYVHENETISGFLTSEIGSTVRAHALVCQIGWRNVPHVVKRQLEENLLLLFEVDLTNQKINDYVDKKMAKLYSVFKRRLHKHYLACGTPREGRANPLPFDLWNGRPKQHWHWLCDKLYTAKDFLFLMRELSKTNVKNRKQLKFHHKGGAMPFIQHAKKAAKNGGHLSVIDNWETLHKDENQQWVHDVAREKHGVLKQMWDECREKLIVEAPEDIPHDYVHVPLRDE